MRDLDALIAFLSGKAAAVFAWGSEDCARFAFGAAKAQTGRDIAAELGIDWRDERSARRILKRLGGLDGLMDRARPRTPCAMAHRGDIGVVVQPNARGEPELRYVVVEGVKVVGLGPERVGLMRLDRAAMTIAWDVEGAVPDVADLR
jgi:hypothetical protein